MLISVAKIRLSEQKNKFYLIFFSFPPIQDTKTRKPLTSVSLNLFKAVYIRA